MSASTDKSAKLEEKAPNEGSATYHQIIHSLKSKASETRQKATMRFFQSGIGKYGHGDQMMGYGYLFIGFAHNPTNLLLFLACHCQI